MTSLEEVQLAIRAGADAVGLVGVPSSPRAIDDGTIAAITAFVPPPIATFLLTTECTAAGVAQRVLAAGASTVQIVAHLSPTDSEQLPRLLPTTRRVQVIHVEGTGALDLIAQVRAARACVPARLRATDATYPGVRRHGPDPRLVGELLSSYGAAPIRSFSPEDCRRPMSVRR